MAPHGLKPGVLLLPNRSLFFSVIRIHLMSSDYTKRVLLRYDETIDRDKRIQKTLFREHEHSQGLRVSHSVVAECVKGILSEIPIPPTRF